MESELKTLIAQSPVTREFVDLAKGNWHCPRCNELLFVKGIKKPEMICGNCGVKLSSHIIYHLVEVHPHKKMRDAGENTAPPNKRLERTRQ